ncbi:MAG: formate dehydrogenase subunit alpha [Dehalococcoidales bacterium]|nr:MAG: formate dehydrogenase subunit alpha [Dehalococcoidales bacterium]
MEAITITLDEIEVSGYPGMTILDLARESGVSIPTLCHDPLLSSIGACRICLVEEETSKALLASCVTPIRAGMVINTHSPRVLERRKLILEFLLASHPDSCLVCDKGNRCELRNLASEMGIGKLELNKIPLSSNIVDVNPFLERDLSKCIMCARCIRADQELVVIGAIDYVERGFISRPSTFDNLPLENSECTFCGTCVSFCPTGALKEKKSPYNGTTSTVIDTICPYCGCGCNISLEVKNNKIIRVRPVNESPVNKGTLCTRGSYGLDFIHHPDRLTTPSIKNSDGFQETSWEDAISFTSKELKRIKDEYGPDSIAVLGSSKCTNEDNYLLQKFTRCVLETNNIDNGSRMYNAPSREGLGWSIGFPLSTNSLSELEQSDSIIVIGANPAASAPAVSYAIKRAVKNNGAKLIVIDPCRTELFEFAQTWLKPRIGSDTALINGIAKTILDNKTYDEEFVTRRTDNFDDYSGVLSKYSPEYVENITGVPKKDLQLAAKTYSEVKTASIVYGTGITQQRRGTAGVIALANLAMLTGNTGHHGGGIFALQKENNAQGACDMGTLPDFLPGYRSFEETQSREIFKDTWQAEIPERPGMTALEVLQQAESGNIKGMLIVGENPVASFPDPALVRRALSSLEFLCVADIFPSETTELASVVMPAVTFAEKDGSFTNFEGRVQQVRRAINPPGIALPEWEIILRLSGEMGASMQYASSREIMNEIEEVVPLYQNISHHDFEQDDDELDSSSERLGSKRFYKGLFPSGFGRFTPVEYDPSDSEKNDQYPLVLVTGSTLHGFGSGSRSDRASRLKSFSTQAWLNISDGDLNRYKLKAGDYVRIISPAGEISAVVRVSDDLDEGMLFMPSSFADAPVNALFDLDNSNSSKTCSVRLERIDNND